MTQLQICIVQTTTANNGFLSSHCQRNINTNHCKLLAIKEAIFIDVAELPNSTEDINS